MSEAPAGPEPAPRAAPEPERAAAAPVDPAAPIGRDRAFRWACLLVATGVAGYLCWAVDDLRREAKAASHAVNQHLPSILTRVEASSATLADVSEDLKRLRELAGAGAPRDKSLTLYANRLLALLEEAPVQVGLKKLLGKGLKEPLPAAEWARDGRKEALWLAFRARSKRELLDRLCLNKFGSDWLVAAEGAQPEPLRAWFAARDPETQALLAEPAPPAGE